MENGQQPFDLLNLIADVSLDEIDQQIEFHGQQLDCLRLLRQILEIREENSTSRIQRPIPTSIDLTELAASKIGTRQAVPEKRRSAPSPKAGIPVAGSLSDRIRAALESGDEKSAQQIFADVGGNYVEDVYKVLNRWRGKLFEKSGANWRLIPKENRPTRIVEEMYPRAGSIMSEAVHALRDGSVLSVKELRARVGRGAFTEYYRGLKTFEARGLFERVGKKWRLAKAEPPAPAGELPPSIEPEPLAADRSAASSDHRQIVLNYLEFNQPAKPTTIGIDTGLDVAEVLAVLEGSDLFRMTDRGWIRAKQPAETA